MHCGTILIGQLEIMLDHIQGGVSKKLLEDKNIAIVPQKRDGKRMSKAMGMGCVGYFTHPPDFYVQTSANSSIIGDNRHSKGRPSPHARRYP